MKRLGIVIASPDDLPIIRQLVRAARAKGVVIDIHLTGNGILAADDPQFGGLCSTATVTICRKSATHKGLSAVMAKHYGDLMTDEDPIADIVDRCNRSMIF